MGITGLGESGGDVVVDDKGLSAYINVDGKEIASKFQSAYGTEGPLGSDRAGNQTQLLDFDYYSLNQQVYVVSQHIAFLLRSAGHSNASDQRDRDLSSATLSSLNGIYCDYKKGLDDVKADVKRSRPNGEKIDVYSVVEQIAKLRQTYFHNGYDAKNPQEVASSAPVTGASSVSSGATAAAAAYASDAERRTRAAAAAAADKRRRAAGVFDETDAVPNSSDISDDGRAAAAAASSQNNETAHMKKYFNNAIGVEKGEVLDILDETYDRGRSFESYTSSEQLNALKERLETKINSGHISTPYRDNNNNSDGFRNQIRGLLDKVSVRLQQEESTNTAQSSVSQNRVLDDILSKYVRF